MFNSLFNIVINNNKNKSLKVNMKEVHKISHVE